MTWPVPRWCSHRFSLPPTPFSSGLDRSLCLGAFGWRSCDIGWIHWVCPSKKVEKVERGIMQKTTIWHLLKHIGTVWHFDLFSIQVAVHWNPKHFWTQPSGWVFHPVSPRSSGVLGVYDDPGLGGCAGHCCFAAMTCAFFLLSDLNQVDTLGSIDIIYINIKVFVAERYHDNLANSTVFFISNISNFI